jgi:hypothetical protein
MNKWLLVVAFPCGGKAGTALHYGQVWIHAQELQMSGLTHVHNWRCVRGGGSEDLIDGDGYVLRCLLCYGE